LFFIEQTWGGKARVLAGGTDLLVSCKLGIITPTCLISLGGVQQIRGIEFEEKAGLRIGMMTTLREVGTHPMVQKYYLGLSQAASSVVQSGLRH
jgi:carbon-monoxide dehydrogenase medium subunit